MYEVFHVMFYGPHMHASKCNILQLCVTCDECVSDNIQNMDSICESSSEPLKI